MRKKETKEKEKGSTFANQGERLLPFEFVPIQLDLWFETF